MQYFGVSSSRMFYKASPWAGTAWNNFANKFQALFFVKPNQFDSFITLEIESSDLFTLKKIWFIRFLRNCLFIVKIFVNISWVIFDQSRLASISKVHSRTAVRTKLKSLKKNVVIVVVVTEEFSPSQSLHALGRGQHLGWPLDRPAPPKSRELRHPQVYICCFIVHSMF